MAGKKDEIEKGELKFLETIALDYIESCIEPILASHLISTRDYALEINKALSLGIDEEKISLASLCHDLARLMPEDEIRRGLSDRGIDPDSLNTASPILLHGPLSAEIAREKIGIEDEEILQAIRIHATGCGEMSVLDKVIYIADKIEPTRDFPGVDDLRKLAFENLDSAFLAVISSVIAWLVARNEPLDYNTVAAYNRALSGKGRNRGSL